MAVGVVERYAGGVLAERWDPFLGTHQTFAADGTVTFSESATQADAEAAARVLEQTAVTEQTNASQISTKLASTLDDLQTLIDTPNATINAGPAPYIKALARGMRLLIRLAIRRLDATT